VVVDRELAADAQHRLNSSSLGRMLAAAMKAGVQERAPRHPLAGGGIKGDRADKASAV